ncbi:MAG: DUF4363 family protein [Syntrophomonadaceae bacterium]|nr:DUF4363 family protein [Syntrophomonadaceae bacterium]
MGKISYYSAIILILVFFIVVMNAGDYSKKPRSESDDVVLYMEQLQQNILLEQWEEAEVNNKKLHKAWQKIIPRIQFSVEKDEINAISVNFSRLSAYITSRENEDALAELYESREHWDNLNK